ncbi:MAG: DoxX family protein [Pseudolabrys sp.]|nr:DoxX family protein [Pseudolabrys sp.]
MATQGQTRLLFPELAKFYEATAPIADALVRIVLGIMFLMHVSGKYKVGAAAVAANIMAKNGLEPALAFAYAAIILETVGGVCLIIGLFTRFFAAALAVEMAIALLAVHLPRGYSAGAGGYEYVLLIGVALLVIALRGGGPYSVDRVIGKEL